MVIMKISIVIPIYNGSKNITKLIDELVKILRPNCLEIILVNDGSEDDSHDACISVFDKYKEIVKYICLSRNFGEHNAVLAGLNYSTGEYAVIIDDDFQNPPEEIQKLIDVSVSGKFDVVYSYYEKKYHSWSRNLGSEFNNMVATCLLNKPKDLYLSSFKCLSRFLIDEIIKYKGPYSYIDGLILRTTRNIGKVLVRHDKRKDGKTGYTMRKLVGLWLNMFVNFSVYPLRLSMFLGFMFSLIGGFLAVTIITEKLLRPQIPVGITLIIVSILVFSGVQLIMLGIMGEYIGKQFLTSNQTPQYVVRKLYLWKP